MEERIIDDEFGRGIRLKKTKDGYVDATDILAPEEEDEMEAGEELAVVLPEIEDEFSEIEQKTEGTFTAPVMHADEDDEDLVDLSPEEAERVRKEKEAELARRKEAYKTACEEGEKLLQTNSYHAAELVFEKALEYDELATVATVGYWRAKTAEFSDPDVLVEEYLEEDIEELESDLGIEALDIIKREYRDTFEKRLQELSEAEAPLLKSFTEKQTSRREVLKKRLYGAGGVFLGLTLPFVGFAIALLFVALQNFSTPDNTFVVPTIVLGVMMFVMFIASLVGTNKFFNAARMYRMNENLSSTEEGKQILDIRQYKDLYEALVRAPQVEDEEEMEEEQEEETFEIEE